MTERILVAEVPVEGKCHGALMTYASYYEGHLNLANYANMGGEHVIGWRGEPQTRIESRRLEPHILNIVEPSIISPTPLETNQEVVLVG